MNRYQSTTATVINKKSIKETDLLITLLTPQMGKVVALAKGVKNIKSSRLGSLQLGNEIKVSLFKKGEYLWISECVSASPHATKRQSLTQLNLLFYFLEVLNQLTAENQHTVGTYPIVRQIIEAINQNKFHHYIQGEINFIKALGFGMPSEIISSFNQKDYKTCQGYIKGFLESIIEKPLESNKLFK